MKPQGASESPLRASDGGTVCAICDREFEPGQRLLWRIKENTEQEFGVTATHLLCPRTLLNILLGVALAAVIWAVVVAVLLLA